MMFYVYILFSKSANKYYIGHSPDPNKRLTEHNSYDNPSKFTAKFQPWELMAYFPVSDQRGEAMKIERFIKKQKSKDFIRKIIAEYKNADFIQKLIHKIVD